MEKMMGARKNTRAEKGSKSVWFAFTAGGRAGS